MAQSTKTKSSSSRSDSRQKPTGSSRSTSAKRSNSTSSSRKSSNGSRAKGASASRSKSRAQSRSAQNRNGAESIAHTAIDKAKTSGRAVADAAGKAKTPLIAGATALVAAAGGAVIKSRLGAGNSKKSPLKRLGGSKQMAKLDLGKLDLDTVKTLATQMKNYGQQASDIADAVEKTRKKN
ncbi:MAG TPA: hypothetical protein VIZ61_15490 [Solirubrobacterales bacterium]